MNHEWRPSDLIRDSRLKTEFTSSGHTKHSFFVSDRSNRQRKALHEERWQRVRELGNGTFGRVWLEQCVHRTSTGGRNRDAAARAVKEIGKGTATRSSIDYSRELEAIAKFSHEKVRYASVLAD